MGSCTEHTILVGGNTAPVLEMKGYLEKMADAATFSLNEKTLEVRLSFDNYQDESGEALTEKLLICSDCGADMLWHHFTADEGGFTALRTVKNGTVENLLEVDRLIRSTDLALLYSMAKGGSQDRDSLAKSFAALDIDPDEPEEVAEAYAIAERLMHSHLTPSSDSLPGWKARLRELYSVEWDEDFDEGPADWQCETYEWLEEVCVKATAKLTATI